MFDTVRAVTKILLEKEHIQPERSPIVIPLDDLCTLWIKYNTSFQQLSEDHETGVSETREGDNTQPPEPLQLLETAHGTVKERDAQPLTKPQSIAQMEVQQFYGDLIEPHKDLLEHHGVLEGVNRMIDLLAKYGDCPSIVIDNIADSEREELSRVRGILLQVSLREHSFNVARKAVQLAKETYSEQAGYIVTMIVVSLGHDLGKIPHVRNTDQYRKADHPLISAAITADIFKETPTAHWLNIVLTMIREHHQSTTDQLTLLFKEADGRARQIEVARLKKDISSVPWQTWFDVKEFLRIVATKVNITQGGDVWKAFSFENIVYCDATFLYEIASNFAGEKNILDITLVRDTDKDIAIRNITDSLRAAGALSGEVGTGYSVRRFKIEMEKGSRKLILVPIKLDAFENYEAIEESKKHYPPIVKGVIPL